MKETLTGSTYRVILVLLIILNVYHCLYNDSPHCDAMRLGAGPEGNHRAKLKLQRTNESSVREPLHDYGWINVCLKEEEDLAISWKTMQSVQEGSKVKLCYEVKRILDRNTLTKTCYLFDVPPTNSPIQLFCWFKTRHVQERLLINAAASHSNKDTTRDFYGELNTVYKENCADACASTAVRFRTALIGCESTGLIHHEEGVNIEQLFFNASYSTQCNNLLLNYSKKADHEIEFSVNCAYNGIGRIYYLYTIRGSYCHKYMTVRVSCDIGTLIPLQSSSSVQDKNQPPSETTILQAAFVVAIFLLAVIFTTIFVVRNRKTRQSHCQEQRRSLPSRNESEQIALRGNIGNIEQDIT